MPSKAIIVARHHGPRGVHRLPRLSRLLALPEPVLEPANRRLEVGRVLEHRRGDAGPAALDPAFLRAEEASLADGPPVPIEGYRDNSLFPFIHKFLRGAEEFDAMI